MVWFWVGAAVVIVLVIAVWRSRRARRIHGGRGVRSRGALYARREAMSEGGSAQTRSEMLANRGDQQLMG